MIMTQEECDKFENKADSFWDAFYSIHQNKFFKDRNWLFTEFPEFKTTYDKSKENQSFNIFEIGCGVGNTIFPVLKYNLDVNLRLYGCDFSSRAIDILQTNENFDDKRCKVFVLDATEENWKQFVPFIENSMDVIVMIFVLSAIHPEK